MKFEKGGVHRHFHRPLNYKKLLFGSQQFHLLGTLVPLSPAAGLWRSWRPWPRFWPLWLVTTVRRGVTPVGLDRRLLVAVGVVGAGAARSASTASEGGQLGTLGVTLIYVVIGVAVQYLIGLGLACCARRTCAGRRFFRVVFFLPMMITPVGVAYTFRMLTDTTKGPFAPIWQWVGLGDFAWAATAWGARIAVMIGDAWQWIPFMFIVLLAAIEGQPQDQVEAAMVDGATRWQIFRYHHLAGDPAGDASPSCSSASSRRSRSSTCPTC